MKRLSMWALKSFKSNIYHMDAELYKWSIRFGMCGTPIVSTDFKLFRCWRQKRPRKKSVVLWQVSNQVYCTMLSWVKWKNSNGKKNNKLLLNENMFFTTKRIAGWSTRNWQEANYMQTELSYSILVLSHTLHTYESCLLLKMWVP